VMVKFQVEECLNIFLKDQGLWDRYFTTWIVKTVDKFEHQYQTSLEYVPGDAKDFAMTLHWFYLDRQMAKETITSSMRCCMGYLRSKNRNSVLQLPQTLCTLTRYIKLLCPLSILCSILKQAWDFYKVKLRLNDLDAGVDAHRVLPKPTITHKNQESIMYSYYCIAIVFLI